MKIKKLGTTAIRNQLFNIFEKELPEGSLSVQVLKKYKRVYREKKSFFCFLSEGKLFLS